MQLLFSTMFYITFQLNLKNVTIVQLHLICYVFVFLSKLKLSRDIFQRDIKAKDDRSRLMGMETVTHAALVT